MSKKNSNVILKSAFKNNAEISKIYLDFKKELNNSRTYSYAIAVSGGPDSLALVALAKELSMESKKNFYYILIDHKIRKNSSREAKSVKDLLYKHGITLKVIKNNQKITKNIQSKAREIRYKLLTDFCKINKIKTLLTAHNLEDQVETFFIRLSRGSGLTGLSGMNSSTVLTGNIKLQRPLLSVNKRILEKISYKVFGKYLKDPSNNNEKYLRTRVRKLRQPLKKSGINYEQIIKSINNLNSSRQTLDQYLKEILKKTLKKSHGKITVNYNEFKKLNLDIQIRIINKSIKMLKKNYYTPRSKKVINLINRLNNKSFKRSTLGGCLFDKKKDLIYLKIEKK